MENCYKDEHVKILIDTQENNAFFYILVSSIAVNVSILDFHTNHETVIIFTLQFELDGDGFSMKPLMTTYIELSLKSAMSFISTQ